LILIHANLFDRHRAPSPRPLPQTGGEGKGEFVCIIIMKTCILGAFYMPIFEFRCLECGNLFEKILVKSGDTMEMRCPECKCESFERVLSKTSHVMAKGAGEKPQLTTKSCGSGNSCYTLDVPGPTK